MVHYTRQLPQPITSTPGYTARGPRGPGGAVPPAARLMELHLRIPAERWCITKKEFFQFVADVRHLWSRGHIPMLSDWPNLKHQCKAHGPNLYEVNVHHVRPLTLAAGGMSYALMKHPEGLQCQVFVSHAWAEGIFELSSQVQNAWPQGLGLQNLYCCLLANPQNLDIEGLLNRPPIESPFAIAMQCASHVLVIPNDTVSIYTRLWCVYEIFLASQWKKTCVLPAKPLGRASRHMVTRTLLPSAMGFPCGCFWLLAIHLSQDEAWHIAAIDVFLLASLSLLLLAVGIDVSVRIFGVCSGRCSPRVLELAEVGFWCLKVCMQFSSSVCVVPWLALPCGFSSVLGHLLHYSVAIGVCLGCMVLCLVRAQTELEQKEVNRQASCLSFAICQYSGIPYETLVFEDSEPILVDEVLRVLRESKGTVTHLSLVHHETTAGVINPLEDLVRRAKAEFPEIQVLVDSMSGFGAYDLDMTWGIDFAVSSANKCIEGVPGFAYVLCEIGALKRCKGHARSLTMDIYEQWANMEATGQFRYTPPTHAILAFKQALVEFHEEGGVEARKARYRANYEVLAREMQGMGFEFYVPEACRSYCICTFKTPEHPNFHFQSFYNLLAEQGFVIYPGKLSKGNSFRIGIIGRLFPKDCEMLCLAVRKACNAMKVPLPL